jgi:hypothetical protein
MPLEAGAPLPSPDVALGAPVEPDAPDAPAVEPAEPGEPPVDPDETETGDPDSAPPPEDPELAVPASLEQPPMPTAETTAVHETKAAPTRITLFIAFAPEKPETVPRPAATKLSEPSYFTRTT